MAHMFCVLWCGVLRLHTCTVLCDAQWWHGWAIAFFRVQWPRGASPDVLRGEQETELHPRTHQHRGDVHGRHVHRVRRKTNNAPSLPPHHPTVHHARCKSIDAPSYPHPSTTTIPPPPPKQEAYKEALVAVHDGPNCVHYHVIICTEPACMDIP